MRMSNLVLTITLSFSIACTAPTAEQAPVSTEVESTVTAASEAQPPSPVSRQTVIAMVGDDSLSTVRTLVPRPLPADVERLLAVVARTGGDFGWTSICADSRRPMLRVHIEPPPAAEPEPALPQNVFLREAAEIQRNARRQRHTELVRQWQQRTDAALAVFMAEMRGRLASPITCSRSDVFGAIARALLMLCEPDIATGTAPDGAQKKTVLLVVSDGDDTAGHRPVAVPDAVHTVIVNGIGTRGDLRLSNAVAFEALDPSIRHIERFSQE